MVVKGRNRDTAWYAILDREWPAIAAGFEAWLAPSNFDDEGRQRTALRALIEAKQADGAPQSRGRPPVHERSLTRR